MSNFDAFYPPNNKVTVIGPVQVEVDDSTGNPITPANPFPVNIYPAAQIPFSLGTLALSTLISEVLGGLTYASVTSQSITGQEILTFYDSAGSPLQAITLTMTGSGWVLNLGVPLEDFLLLEEGGLIELEGDVIGAILLEN